jgi:hypothetical protein
VQKNRPEKREENSEKGSINFCQSSEKICAKKKFRIIDGIRW